MRILENEDIKNHVNYRIGGTADYLIVVEDEKKLLMLLIWEKRAGVFLF